MRLNNRIIHAIGFVPDSCLSFDFDVVLNEKVHFEFYFILFSGSVRTKTELSDFVQVPLERSFII